MTQTPLLDRPPPNGFQSTRRPRRWLSVGVACLLVVAGFSSMMRPPVRGADTPLAEFSAVRAKTHVDRIAVEPHPMGSAEIRLVEAYITGQLTGMGLEPEVQPVDVPDYFGRPGETTAARNIIVEIPGTDPSKAIAFVAHYDTVPSTPGANDDSAAVATLIEAARAVMAGERLTNDILLLFTDGEEPNPRFGASAFAERHSGFGDIGLVVNLEALGSSGPSLMVETSAPETGIVDRFIAAAPNPAAFSFVSETVDFFGGVGTDFDLFKQRAVPGLSFAYLRGSPIYHTERDSVDSVSMRSLQHQGDHVMTVIREFGSAQLPPAEGGADSVFFAVTPLLTVGYSATVAMALGTVAVAALGALVWVGLRSKRFAWGALGRGIVVLIAGSMASALVVWATWWALTAVRPTPGLWESYLYLALMCVAGVAVLSFVGGSVAGPHSDSELSLGIVAVWVVVAAVSSFLIPGFSYLFVWPALGGLVALAVSWSGRMAGWLWLVVAAPAVVLSIPALDFFFQMAQPRPGNPDSNLIETAAVVGLLVALIVGLIVPFLPHRRTG